MGRQPRSDVNKTYKRMIRAVIAFMSILFTPILAGLANGGHLSVEGVWFWMLVPALLIAAYLEVRFIGKHAA